ncbi:imelysin family protein [Bordetella sp. 15P40C-2]|uniref:imelysin family protein n=1 Tax=Bordetella sp. 15P40C-2 TaxID=2572246 RepID=UPI0013656991|nr:imelysin family protein [Bordetella sp. 15P40C-2]
MKLKQWMVAALVATAPWPALAQVPADIGQRLAEGYARPATVALANQAAGLETALKTWCDAKGRGDANAVREAFAGTVKAWAAVAFLRFGPLVQSNRYEKLAFWPDTRGVMPRQVRTLLAAEDPALLAPGALASRSVATQGLPALEFVLYDSPGLIKSPEGEFNGYACAYAVAVAANVSTVAGELRQAWSAQGDFGKQFVAPGAHSDLYRNKQEVAAEAIKALSTGLQSARDIKLMPMLGASPQQTRESRGAFSRSGLTVPALAAGVKGLHDFYSAAAFQYPDEEAWIGPAVGGELARGAQALDKIDAPLATVLDSENGWRQLSLAGLILKNAKDIVDQNLAPALGITIGFNALDGD